jgi:hypothetical protein
MAKEVTLQPKDILAKLGVKDLAEGEKILDTCLKLLVYLKPGDKLRVGGVTYSKLDVDTIYVESKILPRVIHDTLQKKRIIRVPSGG